jgi:N,N'-diacetyllegionaminate synthase
MQVSIEIIAEMAQGYEGNAKLAQLLVKGAIAANADAVKIQLVYADELCVPGYPYFDLFRSLEMADQVWSDLVKQVHSSGKRIYFDVYGDRSLSLAIKLGADGVKISTTDFYNLPVIKNAFAKFDTVFVSTGGIPIDDLDSLLQRYRLPAKLTLMHGFQAEPTETADNNLARIRTLRARYPEIGIGFMDHSVGSGMEAYYLPLLALGLGVSCIEKHITLDYSLEIEDYISALSIDRFGEFVKIIHRIQPALGSPDLTLTSKEIDYKNRAGKVVVASRDLSIGACITEGDVAMKRVSSTPSENYYRQVLPLIGKKISVAMTKDSPFDKDHVQ